MNKRWTIFLVVTLLIYLFFMQRIKQQQQVLREQQAKQQLEEKISEGEETRPTGGRTELRDEEAPTTETRQVSRSRAEEPPAETEKADIISVNTELFSVELTSRGGRPVKWDMYVRNSSDNDDASSHVISFVNPLTKAEDRELPLEVTFREYNSLQTYSLLNRMIHEYRKNTLPNGDIEVFFKSPEMEGIYITRKYVFHPDSYLTDLEVTIHNDTNSNIRIEEESRGMGLSWGPGLAMQLDKDNSDPLEKRYVRAFYSMEDGKTDGFKPSEKKNQEVMGDIIWGGQNTRFLLAVMIPEDLNAVAFQSTVRPRNLVTEDGDKSDFEIMPATATLWMPAANLEPKGALKHTFKIFTGPRKQSLLEKVGYELERALYYTHMGVMQGLCTGLFFILKWMHKLLQNYGLAIIGLTIVVRALTFPLTYKGMKLQAKAMAEQAKIKPFIEEINEKYKDNPQMKNKKMMELYREHGINPLGFLRGCLPLILQMPIFISLYFLLSESFELRNASFLWIKDLSSPDRLFTFDAALPIIGNSFNLLPILMGASQIVVSKFTSTAAADPNQKTMMYFFPLFFVFILYNLPAGLILYWLTSNVIQATQQIIINKHRKREEAESAPA